MGFIKKKTLVEREDLEEKKGKFQRRRWMNGKDRVENGVLKRIKKLFRNLHSSNNSTGAINLAF